MAGSSNLVDLVVGLAWPGIAAYAIWSFRQPLTRLIDRLKSASYEKGKIALEMHEALDRSAEEAQLSPQRAQAPTSAELARAETMEQFNDLFAQSLNRKGPFLIDLKTA